MRGRDKSVLSYTSAAREDDKLEVLAEGGDSVDHILEHLLIDSDLLFEVLTYCSKY